VSTVVVNSCYLEMDVCSSKHGPLLGKSQKSLSMQHTLVLRRRMNVSSTIHVGITAMNNVATRYIPDISIEDDSSFGEHFYMGWWAGGIFTLTLTH